MIPTQLRILIFFIITFSVASCGSDNSNSPEINCDSINKTDGACQVTPKEQDSDNDGILDHLDNCINNANQDQLDTDLDNIGDICDTTPYGPDSDDDGIPDINDNCPNFKNTNQQDKDSDNIGDLCDSTPLGDDQEAPIAKILFPPKFSISKSNSVTIRGVAEDATQVSHIMVNGIAAQSTDDYENWTVELELEQGLNNITVETSDSFNVNLSSASAQVQVTGPALISPGATAADYNNDRIYWLDSFGPLLSADLTRDQRSKILIQNSDSALPDPEGIVLNSTGDTAYITDSDLDAVIKLDLETGVTQVLSTCPTELSFGDEIVLDHIGHRLLIADSVKDQVVAVDINTGNCTVLFTQGSSIGGLAWNSINQKIYFGSGNSLYVYDERNESKNTVTSAMQGPIAGHVKHLVFHPQRNRIIWQASNLYYDKEIIYSLNPENNEIIVITDNDVNNEESELYFSRNMILSPDSNHVLMMKNGNHTVMLSVNLDTGEHNVAMRNLPTIRDQGPSFLYPTSVISSEGFAYVIDPRQNYVLKIDQNTGDKTILLDQVTDLSSLTTGINDVRIDHNNNCLYIMTKVDTIPEEVYLNDSLPEFIKIDLATNTQTVISPVHNIGNEPDLHYANDFVLDIKRNRILALDTQQDEIVAINIATGERNIFSGTGIPDNQNEFSQIQDAVIDTNDDRLLVTDSSNRSLMAINLDSGQRSVFSEQSEVLGLLAIDNDKQRMFSLKGNVLYQMDLTSKLVSTISNWNSPSATNKLSSYDEISYNKTNNSIYVTDTSSQVLFTIDIETGARMILSN